jgi:phosphatidate cytidylyltransferase
LLRTRIITGLALGIAVSATILFLGTGWTGIVFGLIWLVGAWEWGGLVGFGAAGRVVYAGLLLLLLALAAVLVGWDRAAVSAVLWVVAAGWVLAFVGVLTYPRKLHPVAIAAAGWLALGAAWLALVRVHGSGTNGPWLALLGLAIVWGADVGAYFVGRTFGRIKLAPRVSPGKTWEGVGGGIALAVAVAAAAAYALGLPALVLVPAAVLLAPVSVVGDLTVSMLKRRVGLKDCSQVLPGHGGVMDRMDGVTAALPIYALALQFGHMLD